VFGTDTDNKRAEFQYETTFEDSHMEDEDGDEKKWTQAELSYRTYWFTITPTGELWYGCTETLVYRPTARQIVTTYSNIPLYKSFYVRRKSK
jgi:hypothetical protein